MRIALAVVVVIAMAVVGFGAVTRIADREQPAPATSTADGVAQEWAAAVAGGEVERLTELASDRTDLDELRAAHEQILPELGEVDATVTDVAVDDNVATAELALEARPVEGASWQWRTQLPLVRGRGQWSVEWTPAALHPELRAGWRLLVEGEGPTRAPILDREGRALSRTGDVVEIGVQPGRLPDRGRTLVTIADALPAAFEPLQELLDRDDLRDDWYYPLTTVPVETADEAWPDLLTLPGLIRRDAEAGIGPATVAADLVGTIGQDEDGRRVGTSGLEEVFDDRLRGAATTTVVLVDPDGGRRGALYEHQQDVSPSVVTTLDLDVQRAVERAVGDTDDTLGVVVVDATTGGVTAAVSRPASGFARALEGRYPPSLVAGVVPLAAGIRAAGSADWQLPCPATGTAGGVTVTALRPGDDGSRDAAAALTGACDVGVAQLGAELGGDALQEAVGLLGLSQPVELPVAATGWSWPAAEDRAAVASAAIGHARVEASPLGAATLAASVSAGRPLTPVVLVEDLVDSESWPVPVAAGLRAAFARAGEEVVVGDPDRPAAGVSTAAGRVRGDPTPDTGWWVGQPADGSVGIAVVVEGDDDGSRAAAVADAVVRQLGG